ncbi:ABC transporter ATP-binding protein [Oceanirhabdus sp. W0125-5]|uniref:ABC transporter ATP-binding protein n=1 Tax=Oceanirhabdus sp. W0125-5 TaxID=2999116 RepID=UPI0022F30B8C|nr:ABC transporter ATP-binding protein [Oceanirhabdus sp. W0125-5]WBW94968.1 ABC transporter ATP-binding protein [Oceanirhabdus sp. W0125-5]
MSNENLIYCENLIKIYKTDETEVVALQGLDLTVKKGEMMAIIGNSGSGKSTLMNMIGGLDRASAGKLIVDGKDLFKIKDNELIEYKRDTVGFVWQNNARNLMPYLSAEENIEYIMSMKKGNNKKEKAHELLKMVNMYHRRKNNLSQLSGGEQQRVAIAIALCNSPKLLLADEPTGSVDTKTSESIIDVFRKVNKELGVTVVLVSHDRNISKMVDRVVAISDGRTSKEFIKRVNIKERFADIDKELESNTHDEVAVIDKRGRIHIPDDYIQELNIKGKVKMEIQDKKITIAPYIEG